MKKHLVCSSIVSVSFLFLLKGVRAFVSISRSSLPIQAPIIRAPISLPIRKGTSGVCRAFDISKPVFDVYSFQQIRGDALTKYNTLNQSEPLRINLYLFATLALLFAPFITQDDSINSANSNSGVPLSTISLCWLGATGTAGLFFRESQRRTQQLLRLEKELRALDLSVQLPSNALADSAYNSESTTIREVLAQDKRLGLRFLVLQSNEKDLLSRTLEELRVLGRRLQQSNTYVVVVPSATDSNTDLTTARYPWLAKPSQPKEWQEYMSALTPSSSYCWFGLTPSGRSFASGASPPPSWLQVLGKNLSPYEVFLPPSTADKEQLADDTDDAEATLLKLHTQFYQALTMGQLETMTQGIFDTTSKDDYAVSQIVSEGGRLDSWETCLQDDARPQDLTVGDVDVTIVDPDALAYTTCIEFVNNSTEQTLLAVQKWTKNNGTDHPSWNLQLHQTIPWTTGIQAGGMLLCDQRGCVSLVRSVQ